MSFLDPEIRARYDSLEIGYIEEAAKEFSLPIDNAVIQALGTERYLRHLAQLNLVENAQEIDLLDSQLRQKNQELEELIYDEKTGLLLFGPAIKKSRILFEKIDRNLEDPSSSVLGNPNAALVVSIDVEALHTINNRWGDAGGDESIMSAGKTLIDAAVILRTSFRTHDRRSKLRDSINPPREEDIIARRQEGDELFAVMPFYETDEFTRVMMAEIWTSRIKRATKKNGTKKLYLHSGIAFHDYGKTIEEALKEADPKVTTRIGRIVRSSRKIGRRALSRY